jgi:hypothetical protein
LPKGFPSPPPGDIVWPEPAVPRSVIESLSTYVPVEAIQGKDPPTYDGQEARLFTATSPLRPAVSGPSLVFEQPRWEVDETFSVGPGAEVFTGLVLQWGDEWQITGKDNISVGGRQFDPDGDSEPVYDARFPVPNAPEHCLIARLNNYFVVRSSKYWKRWLYLAETFMYLRLNQLGSSGTGAFAVRVRVRGSRRNLALLREVSCVIRDHKDPDRRIDGIGGIERDGTPWSLSLDEAINQIASGVIFFVRQPGVPAAEITVRTRKKKPYLATFPDIPRGREIRAERRNNLSWRAIPEC